MQFYVESKDDKIEYLGRSEFLEADIWGAFSSRDKARMFTKCPDLTDREEINREAGLLIKDAETYLSKDFEVISRFDQIERHLAQKHVLDSNVIHNGIEIKEYMNRIKGALIEAIEDP